MSRAVPLPYALEAEKTVVEEIRYFVEEIVATNAKLKELMGRMEDRIEDIEKGDFGSQVAAFELNPDPAVGELLERRNNSLAEVIRDTQLQLCKVAEIKTQIERFNANMATLQMVKEELRISLFAIRKAACKRHLETLGVKRIPTNGEISRFQPNLEGDAAMWSRPLSVSEMTFKYVYKMACERQNAEQRSNLEKQKRETVFDFYALTSGPKIKTRWSKMTKDSELFSYLTKETEIIEGLATEVSKMREIGSELKEEISATTNFSKFVFYGLNDGTEVSSNESEHPVDAEVYMFVKSGEFKYVTKDLEFSYPEVPKLIYLHYLVAADLCDRYLDYRLDAWKKTYDRVKIENDRSPVWNRELFGGSSEGIKAEEINYLATEFTIMSCYVEEDITAELLEIYVHREPENEKKIRLALVPRVMMWTKAPMGSNAMAFGRETLENLDVSMQGENDDETSPRKVKDVRCKKRSSCFVDGTDAGRTAVLDIFEKIVNLQKPSVVPPTPLEKDSLPLTRSDMKPNVVVHHLDDPGRKVLPIVLQYDDTRLLGYSLCQPKFVTGIYIREVLPKFEYHSFFTRNGTSVVDTEKTNFGRSPEFLSNSSFYRNMPIHKDPSKRVRPLATIPPQCLFTNNVLKLTVSSSDVRYFIMKSSKQIEIMSPEPWREELSVDLDKPVLKIPAGLSDLDFGQNFRNAASGKFDDDDVEEEEEGEDVTITTDTDVSESDQPKNMCILYAHLFKRTLSVLPDKIVISEVIEHPRLISNFTTRNSNRRESVRFYLTDPTRQTSVKKEECTKSLTTPSNVFLDLSKCRVIEDVMSRLNYGGIDETITQDDVTRLGDVTYLQWNHEEACDYMVEFFDRYFSGFLGTFKDKIEKSSSSNGNKFKPPSTLFHDMANHCKHPESPFSDCIKWSYVARYSVKYTSVLSFLKLILRLSKGKVREGCAFSSPLNPRSADIVPDLSEGWKHEDLPKLCFDHCYERFYVVSEIERYGLYSCCHSTCAKVLGGARPVGNASQCLHLKNVCKLQQANETTRNFIVSLLGSQDGRSVFESGIKLDFEENKRKRSNDDFICKDLLYCKLSNGDDAIASSYVPQVSSFSVPVFNKTTSVSAPLEVRDSQTPAYRPELVMKWSLVPSAKSPPQRRKSDSVLAATKRKEMADKGFGVLNNIGVNLRNIPVTSTITVSNISELTQ